MIFVMSLRLSDQKVLHNITSSSSFFRFRSDFLTFLLVFRTSNFWSLRNLMKQLFHSRLLDMRLVIANKARSALLAIYHLISNARSWNNCFNYLKIVKQAKSTLHTIGIKSEMNGDPINQA